MILQMKDYINVSNYIIANDLEDLEDSRFAPHEEMMK